LQQTRDKVAITKQQACGKVAATVQHNGKSSGNNMIKEDGEKGDLEARIKACNT
jgi:hypothetical protein